MPKEAQFKYLPDRIWTGDGRELSETALVLDEDGRVLDLVPEEHAGDCKILSGSISPGFINAHCHLELSHLHGRFPRATGMLGFLDRVNKQRQSSSEEIEEGIEIGMQQMLESGIVGLGDICNSADALQAKLKAEKNGAFRSHSFIELFGLSEDRTEQMLQHGEKLYEQHRAAGLASSINPHAPYSALPELFQQIRKIQTRRSEPLSIHMHESIEEIRHFSDASGGFVEFFSQMGIARTNLQVQKGRPLNYVLEHLEFPGKLLLVHNVYLSESDLNRIEESPFEVGFCLCPRANWFIQEKVPPASKFQASHQVMLGTDSLASNDDLSILQEIIFLKQHFGELENAELIRWACSNAARFFKWDDSLGLIEAGKAPGILLISPHEDHQPLGSTSKVSCLHKAVT